MTLGFSIAAALDEIKGRLKNGSLEVELSAHELERLLKSPKDYDHPLGPAIYAFSGMPTPREQFDSALKSRGLLGKWMLKPLVCEWVFYVTAEHKSCEACTGTGLRRYIKAQHLSFESGTQVEISVVTCETCRGVGTVYAD